MYTPLYLSKISDFQVSNRHPSVYYFLENFPLRIFLFHTPCLSNFGNCSSQDLSTVTKNPFSIFPKIFPHRLSFVRISEVIVL